MHIKIITTESFPMGMAASNRILSYAKGFSENNCSVSVHCMRPTEDYKHVFNKFSSGKIHGISYNYSPGKTTISRHFIKRRLDNFIGIGRICLKLLRENEPNKTDAIIYYSESTSRAFLLYIVTRVKKIVFLKEESEFPMVYSKDMNFLQKLSFKKHYALFDGLLLMTNTLIKHFTADRKMTVPYLHVPMTVDFQRFNHSYKRKDGTKYIAYCGVLNNKKDGIDILIEAFTILAKEFPELSLYLIGAAASNEEYQQYLSTLSEKKIQNKVLLTGRVDKDAIPELLINATILVLPRPKSMQAAGGFPTKLGEYLATGNPVVVTSVGEIPDYLIDEQNAFIAEPGNVPSLVSKIKTILLNYDFANQVGENGRKLVEKSFNYQIQARAVISFIKSFKKCVA
jgi:glycosyltransferase involved in cell wall biosynthesis